MLEVLEINNICIACDSCKQVCPEGSIITNGKIYAIDTWSCTQCELCIHACPVDCIKYTTKNSNLFSE